MSDTALLVLGGGPAGLAAARGFRDAGGTGRVVVVAAEARAPYERPPLSKDLLRGELDATELPIEPPAWYAEHHVELLPGTATALDPAARRVTLADGTGLTYATCVLATGAEPVTPPVPGADLPGVHLLRTAEDALALRDAATPGTRALVVGSGFIGCEAAASLRARGCSVTQISREPAPQAARLGPEVAARLAGWLRDEGVELLHETTLAGIARAGGALRVTTSAGALDADLVLLAVGVRPATDLAERAGLLLAEGGEVAADERMRTSAVGVLACGDCCRARHAVAGRALHVEHWGDALEQGAIAGRVAAGAGDARWEQVPGFWSTIGGRTLKYAAWGDGHDEVRLREHRDGGFTAWFGRAGACVGVLSHAADADYEAGRLLVSQGSALP